MSESLGERLAYAVGPGGVVFYLDRDEIIGSAHKDYELIDLAQKCLSGKLTLFAHGQPLDVVDHRWLLQLASDLAGQAAQMQANASAS